MLKEKRKKIIYEQPKFKLKKKIKDSFKIKTPFKARLYDYILHYVV